MYEGKPAVWVDKPIAHPDELSRAFESALHGAKPNSAPNTTYKKAIDEQKQLEISIRCKLSQDPSNVDIKSRLGGVLAHQGNIEMYHHNTANYDRIAVKFREAIQLETKYKSLRGYYHSRLAMCYKRQGKLVEAAEQCDLAISYISNDVRWSKMYQTSLQLVKLLRGELGSVLVRDHKDFADIRDVLRDSPTNVTAKVCLGQLLVDDRGDLVQGRELLESVAREDPVSFEDSKEEEDYCRAAMFAGSFSAALGDHRAAKTYFEKVQRLDGMVSMT